MLIRSCFLLLSCNLFYVSVIQIFLLRLTYDFLLLLVCVCVCVTLDFRVSFDLYLILDFWCTLLLSFAVHLLGVTLDFCWTFLPLCALLLIFVILLIFCITLFYCETFDRWVILHFV